MKEMMLGVGGGGNEYKHPYGDRFLGEVPSSGLITGNTLATRIGLTDGISQNSSAGWLKFLTGEGKTLYVAKLPLRRNVSWDQINARGAVFGTTTVVINGLTYKVRLLKGSVSNAVTDVSGYDPANTMGSEWNRLMYPLVPVVTGSSSIPTFPLSRDGILFGGWADYTQVELALVHGGSEGRFTWCQESVSGNSANRVYRGGYSVSYISNRSRSAVTGESGWRPVLELVE